jgi:hypothetical protein
MEGPVKWNLESRTVRGKVKVKVALEQAVEVTRGSRVRPIALLFL